MIIGDRSKGFGDFLPAPEGAGLPPQSEGMKEFSPLHERDDLIGR